MATNHVIKISAIIAYFDNEKKVIFRGENALQSGHVLKMNFDGNLLILTGEVQASMKDKVYKIQVLFNDIADVTEAKCTCPKGIKCHHIAALLFFGHYNISVTDQTCQWNAPKKKADDKIVTCEELFPPKPFQAIKRQISNEEIEKLRDNLQGTNIGLKWLLKEDPTEDVTLLVPLVEDIIFSNEYFQFKNKLQYLENKLKVTEEQIKKIAEQTIGQSENEIWVLIRKFRLTASNFGPVLQACSRNRYPSSLFKRLTGVYNLDGIKSIQWGKTHEKEAIKEFTNATALEVVPTGLWLHTSGFLGASPDGLVGNNAIIEVKCPYSYRNEVLSTKLKKEDKYIIFYNENNEICVNEQHHYFDQIQGLLHILSRDICYLTIWTLKETVVATVNKNEIWKQNINSLEKFYKTEYLHYILQTKK